MKQLFVEEKLLLMKFVCVFAWADFQIHPAERRFIEKLMDELELNIQSRNCVYGWLQHPPRPEEGLQKFKQSQTNPHIPKRLPWCL